MRISEGIIAVHIQKENKVLRLLLYVLFSSIHAIQDNTQLYTHTHTKLRGEN